MSDGWVSAHDLLNAMREQETEDRRPLRDPDDGSPYLELITGRASTDSNWTAKAACRGRDTDKWFSDDVGLSAEHLDTCRDKRTCNGCLPADDRVEPVLPETAMLAIRMCYRCPVRERCLQEAFELTKPMSFGNLRVYTKHRKACRDKACRGCVPEAERLREQPQGFKLDPMHAGIFGGIPAYIRKRLADRADRVELAEVWLEQLALKRHWTRNAEEKENVG